MTAESTLKRKGPGRPRIHLPGEKPTRKSKPRSVSLTDEENQRLANLCAKLDLDRSEFVRRALRHGWLFRLTDAQLDALRTLGRES